MVNQKTASASDALSSIFDLLLRQQKISEQTNQLVQSIMSDVGQARGQSEKIATLANKVESLERYAIECDRKRAECIARTDAKLKELEVKREQNKDLIGQVERELSKEITDLATDLRDKLDACVNPVEAIISELREKVAFSAGKYGGVAALITTLIVMLLQWLITSHPAHKP